MEFKLVIGTKEGKAVQKEVKDNAAEKFLGKKIGETIKGEVIDLTGYEFTITGGSDKAGIPMRRDVDGPSRKRIFTTAGVGLSTDRKGKKVRKLVAGNTITEQTAQVNVRVVKAGKDPLIAVEEKTEDSTEEKKEEKQPEK